MEEDTKSLLFFASIARIIGFFDIFDFIRWFQHVFDTITTVKGVHGWHESCSFIKNNER